MVKKPEAATLDMGRCRENFPGSAYEMIMAAAGRARQIEQRQIREDRQAGRMLRHTHKPVYAALHELEQGYLGNIRLK